MRYKALFSRKNREFSRRKPQKFSRAFGALTFHCVFGAPSPSCPPFNFGLDPPLVWNRWSKEYLVGLRECDRTTKGGEALPELGTLVSIIDTTIERRFWKLAKISSYIKGRDHVVRAVKLDAVSQGRKIVMERPLQGICPLEIKAQVGGQHIQQERVQEKEVRPRRVAAFAADEHTKKCC